MTKGGDDSIVDMENIGEEGDNDEDCKCLRNINNSVELRKPGDREGRVLSNLRPRELPSYVVIVNANKSGTPGKLTEARSKDEKNDDVAHSVLPLLEYSGN